MIQVIFAVLFMLMAAGLYWYISKLKPAATLVQDAGSFAAMIMLCVVIAVCFFGTIGGFNS